MSKVLSIKVLAEYDGLTRQLHYKYIYAGDQRIAMRDGVNRLHYYLNDHLGSARVVIDSIGTIKDKYHYLAFGSPLDMTTSTGQPNKYTGKPYDQDAGMNLYYYGARYYDSDLGRFTQIDPLRNKYPEWGPYVYVNDDPIRLLDDNGDSARVAANDPNAKDLTTYNDMSRSGELGDFAQSQIAQIDALPFDVIMQSGDVPDTKENVKNVGDTDLKRADGKVTSATVTIDIKDVNKTGDNVPRTVVHEFDHVLQGSATDKPISEKDKPAYEASAKKAEKSFRKSFKGNISYNRALQKFRERAEKKD